MTNFQEKGGAPCIPFGSACDVFVEFSHTRVFHLCKQNVELSADQRILLFEEKPMIQKCGWIESIRSCMNDRLTLCVECKMTGFFFIVH